MSPVPAFRPEAEEDLREARHWYESRRDGLGDEFIACVEAALEQVSTAPRAFATVHGAVRRVLVRRFPYGVFYVIEPGRIVVLAVLHASRDPRRWPK